MNNLSPKNKSLIRTMAFFALCGIVFSGFATENKIGRAPIIHGKNFRHEHELFNYDPGFYPNVVSFDKQNRPYIRSRAKAPCLQTIDQAGKLYKINFCAAIKKQYPQWNGRIEVGPFAEERVTIDDAGNIYIVADLSRSNLRCSLLLASTDHGKTWDCLKLPGRTYRYLLEAPDGNNDKSHPPAMLGLERKKKTLSLLLPEWSKDHKLKIGHNVIISKNSLFGGQHSGGGNGCFSKGDKVYVVWPDSIAVPGKDGTPQYITVYDRKNRQLSSPVFLGSNGHGPPDPHNIPAVTMDSKGYLHCILGSHHDAFKYTSSLKPLDINGGWTKLISIGTPKRKIAEGSYTYAGLNCDRFDNLHVSARWAGNGYINRLVYMRKRCGGIWEPHKILVQPFRCNYSVFYHKQAIDRRGRLFINYATFANHLVKADADAYNRKWPLDKLPLPADLEQYVNGYNFSRNADGSRARIKPVWHDPAILVSGDNGDTWRLAVMADLAPAQGGCKNEDVEVNSIGMPLKKIQPGHFLMGDIAGDADEKPLHPVTITRSFYIGQYEVRVKDFKRFITDTGYKTELERTPVKTHYSWFVDGFSPIRNGSWRNPGYKQNDNYPVTMLTPGDMQAYCHWLSKKENCRYRLPTEAEWEYVCRAGSGTQYSFGNNSAQLSDYAWYRRNSGNHPHEVGKLAPNTWGLYDMHGNLWELCKDYYGAYSDLPQVNPDGNKSAISGHSLRGGSWLDDMHGDGDGFNLRSAARYYMVFPRVQTNWMGFRIVKEIKE